MSNPAARRISENIDAAWIELRAAVARPESTPSAGDWSLAEMLAHIAFWLEAVVPVVNYILQFQPVPEEPFFASGYVPDGGWPETDAHNAREAAWAREQPFDAVLARCDTASERAIATVHGVADEDIEANPGYYHAIAGHLREHLAELTIA